MRWAAIAQSWPIFLALSLTQALPPKEARFGSVGRVLSDADLGEIVRLVEPSSSVWVLLGEDSFLPGIRRVRVFLRAGEVKERIWRGRVLVVEKNESKESPAGNVWRIVSTLPYAYVPAGAPGQLSGDLDPTWPFVVSSELDDETLVSLISFIRSSPRIPQVPEDQAPRNVYGDRPVSAVVQKGESVVVTIKLRELQGHTITLVRVNGEWKITSAQVWIV